MPADDLEKFLLAVAARQLLRPEDPLDWELTDAQQEEVVAYFSDLLYTGHTVRQALDAIQTVWADHVV